MIIKGIYDSQEALKKDAAKAKRGNCFAVGKQTPYKIFKYNGEKFEEVGTLSENGTDIEMPIENLFQMRFKAHDGSTLMVRKGIRVGEVQIYTPAE